MANQMHYKNPIVKYFVKKKSGTECITNKLGLSWAKLSQSWGLKFGFVLEVGGQSMKLKFEDDFLS